ncbi:MAG: phytanoyl-CoA dioxygenase family protein [Sneathiella sp.]|uniref:phytanoyl-CoA dioxygenase family protein n=1 Tax=Sneathiella sp. TaxID=1964365 RepID=UPI0030021D61
MSDAPLIDLHHITTYQNDGVVLIKGLFADWTDTISAGIERNMRDPGRYASENLQADEDGRFFDDYCNWNRIPEFEQVVHQSPAAAAAAALMNSKQVQLFHDHVLVKEPGTSKPTPWHQDAPYYFVEGEQTVSFWSPMDPVKEATLRCVAGSHKWEKLVLPMRWLSGDGFYNNTDEYMPVPDPDSDPDLYRVAEWEMAPGDAIAFNYRTLHGARGNNTAIRRRAFSLRFVGDDARYTARPGPTSPPFPGHGMTEGQKLREDWFPIVYRDE